MATKIYMGPEIWVGTPSTHLWWFHHSAWRPGDWLRASMNVRQNTSSEGCYSHQASVEIVRQWTETRTTEKCGDFRKESTQLVHWVQFRVADERPSQLFRSVMVLSRFVVHS